VFLPPWMTLPPAVTVLISLAFFATCVVVLYPLMRAIGRRIEGRASGVDPALRAELEQLQARVSEVEALQHRLMELEERVDFAERLLSQRREPQRLEKGSG
jgi:Tfp pilus assembly protein PilO